MNSDEEEIEASTFCMQRFVAICPYQLKLWDVNELSLKHTNYLKPLATYSTKQMAAMTSNLHNVPHRVSVCPFSV